MIKAAAGISAERRAKLFNMMKSLTEISGELFINEARKKIDQIRESGLIPFIPESREKTDTDIIVYDNGKSDDTDNINPENA